MKSCFISKIKKNKAGEISKELSDKIYEQKDLEILKLAAKAESVSDFEKELQVCF